MPEYRNVPISTRGCSFCEREIPLSIADSPLTSCTIIDKFKGPDQKIHKKDSQMEEACYHCSTEIENLLDKLDEKENVVTHGPGAPNFYDYTHCSFCEDELGTHLACITAFPLFEGDERQFIVCGNCDSVISEFLAEVPESEPVTDYCIGPHEIGWLGYYLVLSLLSSQTFHSATAAIEEFQRNTSGPVVDDKFLLEQLKGMRREYSSRGRGQRETLQTTFHLQSDGEPYSRGDLQSASGDPPQFRPSNIKMGLPEVPVTFSSTILEQRTSAQQAKRLRKEIQPNAQAAASIARTYDSLLHSEFTALREDLKQRNPEAWDRIQEIDCESILGVRLSTGEIIA